MLDSNKFVCPCGCDDLVITKTAITCTSCLTTYDKNGKVLYRVPNKKHKELDQQKKEQDNKPQIITCPACNKQVSNQAPSCPHCGQPIDTRPKCPTCGSPDIKKLSHIGKSASIWFWGLTSDKINKTWQCNKCGQTW